ncbi:SDR family oxidoreductase [uncultured Clostridium sp.]|uniref:SDR family oxidoreductase n=1 Tax=uncultured Clostridium sp. TaxID=59620 RepID=UPI00262050AA|nr:SDR family oxidoreductase [uncultured Clostridium sp.]
MKSRGGECLLVRGDITEEDMCKEVVNQCVERFGTVDILINNAAVQYPQYDICDITKEQLLKTFKTNIFSAFYLSKAVIPYMKLGSSIINTTSIVAYRGNEKLIDYSSTKGALTSFTRSLALNLADKGIRVNAVAPGPVWTPLIVSSFSAQDVKKFAENREFFRVAQPVEIVEPYVFLASQAGSYTTGTTIHVDGGKIANT